MLHNRMHATKIFQSNAIEQNVHREADIKPTCIYDPGFIRPLHVHKAASVDPMLSSSDLVNTVIPKNPNIILTSVFRSHNLPLPVCRVGVSYLLARSTCIAHHSLFESLLMNHAKSDDV